MSLVYILKLIMERLNKFHVHSQYAKVYITSCAQNADGTFNMFVNLTVANVAKFAFLVRVYI
jgi:hypothetical protein